MKTRGGWPVSRNVQERNRRSVYVFVRRNTRYPMFESFDMPDTHQSCGRRHRTISSPQALFLLNSTLTLEWARAFAGRVLQEAGPDQEAQITAAYRRAYSRRPDPDERIEVARFLESHAKLLAGRKKDLAVPTPLSKGMSPEDGAAFTDFCHMLINSSEFVYVD